MNSKSLLTRTAVAVPAAALMIAAVPGLASAKSVKVKNGTYKGSILGNSGDEGGDYRTKMSISVSKGNVSKIVLSSFPLWAADQPAGVSNGTAEPTSCQQAGTAPAPSGYAPTITFRMATSNAGSVASPVKISRSGSFSVNAPFGEGEVGTPIFSATYAANGGSATPAAGGNLSFSGKFSSSKKAKGKLSSLSIQMGAGIEKFTCNSYWAQGQTLPWGIPSAPK